MKTWLITASSFAFAAAAVQAQPAPLVTYIHAGHVIDRPSEPPRGATTIVVRDGKIAELREGIVPVY